MITGNLILSITLFISIVGACAMAGINYYRHKKNLYVTQELDNLIAQTLGTLKKAREEAVAEEADEAKEESLRAAILEDSGGLLDLDSPAVLTTILNVLVNKFGDVRLSIQDFAIGEESYVSVYIDSQKQEIILSMKSTLTHEELYSLGSYVDPDDNTFH